MPTSVLRRAAGSPALLPGVVRRLGDAMLAALGLAQAELSVLLTNDAGIHALNRQHRDKDRPTDVLAFPLQASVASAFSVASTLGKRAKPAARAGTGPLLLGDIVISLDTAARQARGRQRALVPEVRFLLAHGLLHLLGYDHGNPIEKRAMTALTRRLVRAVAGSMANPLRNKAPRRARPRASPAPPRSKASKRRARPRARHAK